MYLENDKGQHRNIEIKILFVASGIQRRGTSSYLFIYTVSYLVTILESSLYCILCFSITCQQICLQNYADGNHLLLKYEFIYVSIGPLALEYKKETSTKMYTPF